MTKKREDYVSPAAQRAADRHAEKTQHLTTELYDDDMRMEGMCCVHCDWMRLNVERRKPRPSELQAQYDKAKHEELRLMG